MALLDTDLLAVYRETDQKNYKTSITQLMSRVPAPEAPPLTAVLQSGNISQGINIIVQDTGFVTRVNLSAANASLFTLGLNSYGDVKIGETVKIILENNGIISNNQTNLFGNSEGLALAVYEVGTNIDNKDTKNTTVEVTNAGAATFAGPLEAESIDGGVYATE